MNEAIKMQMSAFVDGELPENEKELLLRRLSQDGGLRQLVAEYMAIGHALRGEVQLGGVSTLRDRVARALGDNPEHGEPVRVERRDDRLVRPIAGVAIAATVALAAIFGLRQLTDIQAIDAAAPPEVAGAGQFPAQPQPNDLLREYRLLHDAKTSYMGANSINARLAAFERLEADVTDQGDPAAEPAPGASDDRTEAAGAQ